MSHGAFTPHSYFLEQQFSTSRPPAAPCLAPFRRRSAAALLQLRAGKHTQWQPLDAGALRRSLVWHELPRQRPSLAGLLRLPQGSCLDFTGVVLKVGLPQRGGSRVSIPMSSLLV